MTSANTLQRPQRPRCGRHSTGRLPGARRAARRRADSTGAHQRTARTLSEIDVGRELTRRGLPPPARQVLRKDRRGRYYLDLYWPDLGVVVEIDGIHHAWAENVVGDALRQNALVLEGDVVLRLPLLGLRLQPDEFFQQISDALAAGRRRAA